MVREIYAMSVPPLIPIFGDPTMPPGRIKMVIPPAGPITVKTASKPVQFVRIGDGSYVRVTDGSAGVPAGSGAILPPPSPQWTRTAKASPEFVDVAPIGEVWEFSERATAELAPVLPSEKDLHDHLLRHLRRRDAMSGVEIVQTGIARTCVVRDPIYKQDTAFHRQKLYARATAYGEDIFGNFDNVRRNVFEAAELLANLVAEQVAAYRAAGGVPVLRFCGERSIALMRSYDNEARYVVIDTNRDAYQVHYRSMFAITTPGEEVS